LRKLKEFQRKKSTGNDDELKAIQTKLQETNDKLNNIINAVVSGYVESAFKDKMAELEDQKIALETRLKELGSSDPALNMDEETLRKLISKFKGFVQEKNIPECKKFIQSFVDRVVVYKDHVEVTLKVTSNFSAQSECLMLKTEEKIKTLFRRFKVA
jgi:site-specific DNA recombinase